MSQSRLIELSYYDPSAEVRLTAYADTLVLDESKGERTMTAIRFGGYPEMVNAMAAAMHGGASIEATVRDEGIRFQCIRKGYTKQLAHDGVYATANLMANDQTQEAINEESKEEQEDTESPEQPRTCYIFCPAGDRERLFEELDRKTAAPLIPAFREQLLEALIADGSLRRMKVYALKSSILHPIDGYSIVTPPDLADFDTSFAKEEKTLEIVKDKVSRGGRVIVYTSWTRTDSQDKLLKLLREAGIRADVLLPKITPEKREEWVEKRVSAGLQVLITNPKCVETGLDLNAFTTLIFYSMGYNLFTLRQASRRSWRINQTAPRVEVYLLYYANTMQAKAMKLMASKLAVAGIIEGTFSDEGLAAMSDVKDMTSQMAKELMQGIKDNVEDIAAAFKKMAIVNPDRGPRQIPAVVEEAAEPKEIPEPEHFAAVEPEPVIRQAAELPQEIEESKPKRARKRPVSADQLSLFDLVA